MNLLSPEEMEALILSLWVATTGTLLMLPIAIALGITMAQYDFRGKFILHNLILLPMVVPPVVVGYLLLILLSREGIIGGFFYNWFQIELVFTWKAAAIVAAIMGFPLMVRAIRLSVEAIQQDTENSARILGAGVIKRLRVVILPLALPGIISGAVMGFGRALGEFGATITVAANIPGATRTLPLALYHRLQQPQSEWAAMRYAIIALIIAAAAIAISEWTLRLFYKRQPHRSI